MSHSMIRVKISKFWLISCTEYSESKLPRGGGEDSRDAPASFKKNGEVLITP